MLIELGHFFLIVGLVLSLVIPVLFLLQRDRTSLHLLRWLMVAVFLCVLASTVTLWHAFLSDNFSVLYVAQHSNTLLPDLFKFTALWGAHEGSLLLWMLVLCLWSTAAAVFSRSLPDSVSKTMIAAFGFVCSGFLAFIIFASNPFRRLLPPALEGADLNPLLQDVAMAIHPPMLYLGYVGFVVAFAFSIAVLWEGRLERAWIRWARPWALLAWTFLTLGISLGSWWAYYELGWGGWWFWDPVENASFMPWLMGTALIHSMMVTEKSGRFQAWTVLLGVFAFALSLFGTFLVRSGIIISVHAFASDPLRGQLILLYIAVIVGAALTLFAYRAPKLLAAHRPLPLTSKESFLLFNNFMLVSATLLILLGTLYPIFLEVFNLGKISVGPPWFELGFLMPVMPMLVAMIVVLHLQWSRAIALKALRPLLWIIGISAVPAIALPWLGYGKPTLLGSVGMIIAVSLLVSTLFAILQKRFLLRSGVGMAHMGVAVFAIGVALTNGYDIEKDVTLAVGESAQVGKHSYRFVDVAPVKGPNYNALQARIEVSGGSRTFVLKPERRQYLVQKSAMTEAAIHPRIHRDLYVALADPLDDGRWNIRIQYKPWVRLIWLGTIIMAAGGIWSVWSLLMAARREP